MKENLRSTFFDHPVYSLALAIGLFISLYIKLQFSTPSTFTVSFTSKLKSSPEALQRQKKVRVSPSISLKYERYFSRIFRLEALIGQLKIKPLDFY